MEKIKWVLIIALFALLIFIIFRKKEEVAERPKNYAEVEIINTIPEEYKGSMPFIPNGTYFLELDYIQRVSGKADGWYMHFIKKNENEDMILTIELSDTTNLFANPNFPLIFHTSQYFLDIPPYPLYRTKMDIGFSKSININYIDEMTIKMSYFSCNIHNIEIHEGDVKFQMDILATHDDFLVEIFKAKTLMKVTVNIDNAQMLERVI